MKIFNGSTSEKLANSICNILCVEFDIDIKPGKLKIDKFLDGEILPLFEETVRDEDVSLFNQQCLLIQLWKLY